MVKALSSDKLFPKKHLRFSRQLGLLLAFSFLSSLFTILTFFLVIRFSLNTLLAHFASENAQLSVLSGELKKEVEHYRQIRNTNDIKLFRQLVSLRSDIAKVANQDGRTLGAEDEVSSAVSNSKMPELLGIVVTKGDWDKVEVFSEPMASSKIVGEVVPEQTGEVYFFNKKEHGWYRIEYKEGKYAWIQEQFVEELSDD